MGWLEMSERELRRAEVLPSVFAGRLTMTAAAEAKASRGARRTGWRYSLRIGVLPACGTELAAGPPTDCWGLMCGSWRSHISTGNKGFRADLYEPDALERHGLNVSRETLCKWISDEGLRAMTGGQQPKSRRRPEP